MIWLIGMGPGHVRCLTQEALETIKQADQIIAFGRIAKTAEKISSPVQQINNLHDIAALINIKGNTAILASGDACFYGLLDYLKTNSIKVDKVLPGITSFQYLMNKLQKSWHDASFVSFHGRIGDFETIIRQKLTVILTDNQNTPDTISKQLHKLGARGKIYTGFNLSYDDEYIAETQIGANIPPKSTISTLIVEIWGHF